MSQFPDRRSDQNRPTVVYFDVARLPELNKPPVIKIGSTIHPATRLKQHSQSPFGLTEVKVECLCMVRGTRADEDALHRHFADHKLPGRKEEFCAHEDLVDYIRWLRDQYFVWVPDCDDCPSLEDLNVNDMEVVDQNMWMPRPERRKKVSPDEDSLFGKVDCSVFAGLNLPPRKVTKDDFYTAQDVIEAARGAMGGIDLDPASHAMANKIVKANRIHTLYDDGLIPEWSGRVWLNPPFSQWQQWVTKIIAEWESGRLEALCLLCATRTLSARYLAPIKQHSAAMCIFHGRIPFWGDRAGTPDDGHAVFYFGHDAARFAAAFEPDIGHVFRRWVGLN